MPSSVQRLAAAAILIGGLTAIYCLESAWEEGQVPYPFLWWDVALVHLAAALPLSALAAGAARRRLSLPANNALAVVALFLAIAAMRDPIRADLLRLSTTSAAGCVAVRVALALLLTFPVVLLLPVAAGWSEPTRFGRHTAGWLALALAALLVLPASYVHARCRDDLARLSAYLDQSQLDKALVCARNLDALEPGHRLRGRPVREVAANIERVLRDLEARAAIPLPFHATDDARLDRARQLAMLGRTDLALEALRAIRGLAARAEADNLRGTIYEARAEWEDGLQAYQTARAAWEKQQPSSVRTNGLVRAVTGSAYCQRKMGRYVEAEASYRELLELSPSADTHFLLAQFYEDAQHASHAQMHARAAISLAPDRYRQKGTQFLAKLATFQFGCLSVFTPDR